MIHPYKACNNNKDISFLILVHSNLAIRCYFSCARNLNTLLLFFELIDFILNVLVFVTTVHESKIDR